MARLKFKNGIVEDYTIVLSTRDFRHLGQLTKIRAVNHGNHLNSANELSFTVCKYDVLKYDNNRFIDYKTHTKIKLNLWNQIVDFKLVWIKELNEYFEIKVTIDDAAETYKTITATSLCEAELSQMDTGIIEINTEADIERDDYEITTFYNSDKPNVSLLHRVLNKAPHYTIKHVDASLMNLQRTFSIDTTIYDFFTGECSEQFNCLFRFNSAERGIYVYDLYTNCTSCGERGEFYDVCPKCGSKNLRYYGKDTTILIDKNNLTDSIQVSTNADEVKNCFKLVAGDDLMTATVRALNPNGSAYIYYFSEEQKKDMPTELVKRMESYDNLMAQYNDEYTQLVSDIFDLTDDILYLQSGMMPTIENAEVTAATEKAKLTIENLSPLALTNVTESTSVVTVNTAIKNYARVYVKTGYVKLWIEDDSTFEFKGKDANGFHYGIWTGRITVTNYSDEEDIATTEELVIVVNDNYEEFVRQKILKSLPQDDEVSIFDVLTIEDLKQFKSALQLYGLNRLKSFYDAIQGALDVLIQLDHASEGADLYETLYLPYYQKLQICEREINERSKEITVLEESLEKKEKRRTAIQNELNFETYLGEYYNTFCAYRREQKYSNENYISDGLDNAELIKNAKQFFETAKKELIKSGETQFTISTTLHNLLVLPEFQPIVDNFELGNWIRLKADGILYRLRLISYEIDFDNTQTINVEFSTVSKLKDIAYEAKQIINSAKSMATSYGYVSKQAQKGNYAQKNIQSWIQNGLSSGLIQIQNNNNLEVTFGKNGLLCRAYDDITGTYEPKQVKITHNTIVFTDNNWESVRQVIGEHTYKKYNTSIDDWDTFTGYGMTADFLQAGWVTGATIVGGVIYSGNYCSGAFEKPSDGSYIDLEKGRFSFAGGKLRWDGDDLIINSSSITTGDNVKIVDETSLQAYLKTTDAIATNLRVNANNILGTIYVDAANISGQLISDQILSLETTKLIGKITSEQIQSVSVNSLEGVLNVASENIQGTIQSNQIAEELTGKIITNGSLLIGDKELGHYTEVDTSGDLFCGNLTANNAVLSKVTTIDENQLQYTGISGEFTLGNYLVKTVNGLVIEIKDITEQ